MNLVGVACPVTDIVHSGRFLVLKWFGQNFVPQILAFYSFLFQNMCDETMPFFGPSDGTNNQVWGVACMRRYGRLFTQCMCSISTFIHELYGQWNWTLETQVSGPWLPGGVELPGWSLLDRCSPSTTIFALSSSSLDLPPTTTSVLPQSKEERQGKSAHRHTR